MTVDSDRLRGLFALAQLGCILNTANDAWGFPTRSIKIVVPFPAGGPPTCWRA